MDVGCTQLDGFFQKIIYRAYDRCTAGEITKALNVIITLGASDITVFGRSEFVLAKPLRQGRGDILKRTDSERDGFAKREFRGTDGGGVAWIGDDQCAAATLVDAARENRHLPKEAVRKRCGQRRGSEQLGQVQSRQLVKVGDFVGKVIGGEVGKLPEIA